jgi:hypothetical protein
MYREPGLNNLGEGIVIHSRFFEVDLDAGELHKHGVKIKL